MRFSTSKRIRKAFLIGITVCAGLSLFQAAPIHAAEWFISPGGNDSNNGAGEATPFKTLSKADSVLAAGDTITVLDGAYPAGLSYGASSITKSGTPKAWITVRAKNPRAPVFSLAESARLHPGDKGVLEWDCFALVNVSYIKLIGLSVQGWNPTHAVVSSGNGICIQSCHHIVIQDCRVSDCSGAGIGGSPEHWIGNEKIKGPLDFITLDGNEVSGCAFWSQYDTSGISLWVATDAGLGADPSGYNMIIRRNISRDNANKVGAHGQDIATATDGNGIIIDSFETYPYATLVEGNLVCNNCGRGITSTHSSNLTYRYNTCWHNTRNALGAGGGGPWPLGELEADFGANVLIENNIAVANSNAWSKALILSVSPAVVRNNLLVGPRWVDKIVRLTESGAIAADPKFINPSADPKVADFRLQAGSPALKAADSTPPPSPDLAGTARRQGEPNDLGAYQQAGK